MNWLDAILLLPILIGLVRGLMRGLITELIAIVAVVLGVIGARIWGVSFATWIVGQTSWPLTVCQIISYTLLFLSIAIILNLAGHLLSRLLKAIHLGFANRLIGGLFGAIKWGLVVLFIVFLVNLIDSQLGLLSSTKAIQDSVLYPHFVSAADHIFTTIKNAA